MAIGAVALSYLERYAATMPIRLKAAAEIGNWMKERMSDLGVACDSVSARAKDIGSARGKVRRKQYCRPNAQMTDAIGVRVVLLFETEIATAVDYLRSALQVNERHSRTAGIELALPEFGYRSVHLVARWRGRTMPSYFSLGRPWVEVQVRSLLQHAWAATGHDHLYKGALVYPDKVKRRFFAIAGSLELFDQEFSAIRAYRAQAHTDWLEAFRNGKRMAEKFDIAGLEAFFVHAFPNSPWSDLPRQRPVYPQREVALMSCLQRAGLVTARDVRSVVRKRGFRRQLNTYASLLGTSPSDVPNFTKVILAINQKRPLLLSREYGELIEDLRLRAVIAL